MITVLDVETTFMVNENRRSDPSPFCPDNKLVSVQYSQGSQEPQFVWFYHSSKKFDVHKSSQQVQDVLDATTLLVGHNIKFDLMWLWETGFTYDGAVYDTMIGEYMLLRGQKWGISLADCCERRNITLKKSQLVDDFLKQGKGFDVIPMETVEEYGLGDIISTRELYHEQTRLYKKAGYYDITKHLNLMNKFLIVLAYIEQNGIKIDFPQLHKVKEDYEKEKEKLEQTMRDVAEEVMGDTPINFASPEQMGQLIYSRKVKDKKQWASHFNIGLNEKGKPLLRPRMSTSHFVGSVKMLTSRMYKTKARQCTKCYGKGTVYKIKKDGTRWKNPTKCKSCSGKGYTLIPLHKIAGLHMNPRDVLDVSANGFATDKTTLIRLLGVAKHNGNEKAVKFLTSAVRLNAVDVYLSSFVGGIERNTRSNLLLHPKFNQCVTRTTRLSSSDPNFQNQPRGSTFPVRSVVVSRFKNGKILQADYSQLEFRVAAQLCGDEKMIKDILEGQDVHKYTASIIFDKAEADVTKEERTAAKAHTFKPLYGGFSGTPREMAYYKAFVEKYPKLGAWHADLQTEAISHGIVRLYTGQQFAFPDTKRLSSGAATNAPSIKNYPVQGVAGGCIVPLALVDLYNKLKDSKSKSLIINTVHDSVVVDIYPGEELQVANMMYDSMTQVCQKFEELYNVKWSVPLEVDLEIGNNWLNMKNYSLT